ncbi:MAG: acyl carrier protein [Gammaproteobacteria bacterium]|nr:acyl carrier protein [Gammaproteobacteria bacterium]
MPKLSPQQLEVANLIVDVLNLEDVDANDIDPDAPLFRDGLGLDSIDALELSLALKQRYGIEVRSKNEENSRIFGSLAGLTDYIWRTRLDDKH